VVDLGLRSAHNSNGSLKSMASGANSTSRLVFRGTEDLGGGMSAGFHLESSFAADTGVTGTGPQFWDRQSTVSLTTPWGELRLGRDWTPVYTGFVFGDPWINVGVGAGSNFLNASASTAYQRAFGSALNPTTLSRSNNAVEYWLPGNLGGVYGHLMVSPGEGGNASGSFRYRAGRLGYKTPAYDVAAYTGDTRIDATGSSLVQTGVYGSWVVQPGMSVMGSVTRSSYRDSKQLHWMGGIRAGVGPWVLKASYNRVDQQGVDAAGASIAANDVRQFAIGADYLLSRRTVLYVTAASLKNQGNARFAIPGGPGVAAAGSSSSGYDLGLRHSF
jgi:predicted porin